METVLSIILIIGFIFLLGIWSLTALYSSLKNNTRISPWKISVNADTQTLV